MNAGLVNGPLPLAPIQWGRRDRDLARAVCRNLAEITPPTLIPVNPINAAKVRAWLRTHHVEHYTA